MIRTIFDRDFSFFILVSDEMSQINKSQVRKSSRLSQPTLFLSLRTEIIK